MTNDNKKKPKKIIAIKLGMCFAGLICAMLIISAFLITINITSTTKEAASEYSNTQMLTNAALNVAIYNSVEKDIENNKKNADEKFELSKIFIGKLQDADIIYNVIVTVDNENNHNISDKQIATTSEKPHDEIISDNNAEEEIEILYGYKDAATNRQMTSDKNDTNRKEFREFQKEYKANNGKKYYINIYAKKERYEVDLSYNIMSNLKTNIINLLIIIIVMGVVTGVYMSEIVSHSLEKLSKAAKKLAGGDFDIKIPKTHYLEINDLISSYNEMGYQLNELYSSLENKVQERTKALEEANSKLKETQAMMVHSEKMRSLGELVAGIAHEINNPVNFIHGNIMILQNYSDDLFKVIDLYDKYSEKLTDEEKKEIEELKKEIDLDFMRDDIKDLIRSCIEGTQRTKNIVLDLKNFSRMEEMVLTQFDIPKEIDTTLNILNNKYKNRITVVKNYSPDVPKIEAYGGQLNQVFMNILDNAQDAIEGNGTVTINVLMSEEDKNKVKIEFIDTGIGIEKENIKKVFEPFFTTKVVGKGTGLGMSISYRVIKDHNGTIDIDSSVGKGTKFTITLPINHETKEA